eukprot:459920-Rhodomonas_salina.2
MGAIVAHLAENAQPDHQNWRSLILRALANVVSAKTPTGLKIHAIQVFGNDWEKLLRRGVQKDLIRFSPEEIASACGRAFQYTQDKDVDKVAESVLHKVGHASLEEQKDLVSAST